VCEHDVADRVKRASGLIVDEISILSINNRCIDILNPNELVERDKLPDNSRQVQRMCNKANAVLCQEKK
jgi:hypothetical protein